MNSETMVKVNNAKKSTKNAGFSLIELIIVIAIMSVLVGVIAPQYLKYVEKAKRAVDVDTAVEIVNASMRVAATTDADFNIEDAYFITCGWMDDAKMPDEDDNTFLDLVFKELNEVPKSQTFKSYFWTVCYDVKSRQPMNVMLRDKKTNTTYELWPNSDDFLNMK